jgi:integral membrane protein
VRNLYLGYRVLAMIVGVLLTVGTFVALPLKYFTPEGSAAQQFGESLWPLWVAHGWIYMAYLVVAFLLARRAKWSLPFTVLMLLAGTVPILIFVVERRVARVIAAEHPEAVASKAVA